MLNPLLSDDGMNDRYEDGPPGASKTARRAQATDRHEYARLVYLDGRYCALKDDTLRQCVGEMTPPPDDRSGGSQLCGHCSGQHTVAQCPRRLEDREDTQEMVDMGKLFGFLA